jgi:hypothetical protein
VGGEWAQSTPDYPSPPSLRNPVRNVRLMRSNSWACLPVVKDEHLVGVLTESKLAAGDAEPPACPVSRPLAKWCHRLLCMIGFS